MINGAAETMFFDAWAWSIFIGIGLILAILELLVGIDTGLDMVEVAVSFYLYLAGKMENQFLLLHRHYPYKLAEENPVCSEHLEAIYDCLVDIFESAVLRGQKDGSIGEMPTRKFALIIFSMVDGITRFKTYNLYEASALYNELIASCRRILKNTE